jgi:hypothetical protein
VLIFKPSTSAHHELEAEQIAKANEMMATESQMDWDFGL